MIHVVARSEHAANIFLENNKSLISDLIIELNQRSYFYLLNHIITTSPEDYACVVHDDVILCSNFNERVHSLISTLNHDWPNWGIAGNAGITPFKIGYATTELIRYLADPHGGPNFVGQILPAMSIDGNVILLNIRALREREICMPDFDGFQLYDIILSIKTISSGLGVFIAPHLACWHGSKRNQENFDQAKNSDSFISYLSKRIINRKLLTLNGEIRVPLNNYNFTNGIDVEIESLMSACRYRPITTVAIVTRTRFDRPKLLDRCLRTISAFIASAGTATEFRSYIVTDRDPPSNLVFSSTVIKASIESQDTRYKLVQFAANNINADYFWFIDDDDWMFPNEALRLSMVINSAPQNSIFFVDCCRYNEEPFPTGSVNNVESYRSKKQHYFSALKFMCSLSGNNQTPFCGVIFSRGQLLKIPDIFYDTVTYLEDFMTTLNTLLTYGSIPVVVNKLYVGISIRETGNTITETDRTKWNRSMSELVSNLVNATTYSQMLSLPVNKICDHDMSNGELAQIKAQLDMITSSRSWRITRPMRGVMRLIRGQLTLKEFASRVRDILSAQGR